MSSRGLSAARPKKSKTESKKSQNRLFSNYFDSFSTPFRLFGPWGREAPGTHFRTLFPTLGPKGPSDPCSGKSFRNTQPGDFLGLAIWHPNPSKLLERRSATHGRLLVSKKMCLVLSQIANPKKSPGYVLRKLLPATILTLFRLRLRLFGRKPLNLIKSPIFTNAPCKTTCLYNAPSMHTVDVFQLF